MKGYFGFLCITPLFYSCLQSPLYKKYISKPGGELYLSKCGGCHAIRNLENYEFNKWNEHINRHKDRIQLTDEEFNKIINLRKFFE